MSHKRGRDKKASEKQELRGLNRWAYCNLVDVPFDAMLKTAQYAERHKLDRFAGTLPVLWPKSRAGLFIGAVFDFEVTA